VIGVLAAIAVLAGFNEIYVLLEGGLLGINHLPGKKQKQSNILVSFPLYSCKSQIQQSIYPNLKSF
jgi:hypothetical protein